MSIQKQGSDGMPQPNMNVKSKRSAEASQSHQLASPTIKEDVTDEEESGLKRLELIVRAFVGLVSIVLCFILAINKVESSMFYIVVWAGVALCGGSDVVKAIVDRLPLLGSKNTRANP